MLLQKRFYELSAKYSRFCPIGRRFFIHLFTFEIMENPSYKLDIEIYKEYGDNHWAQAKYLAHGIDDVLWTNDLDAALSFISQSIEEPINQKNRIYENGVGLTYSTICGILEDEDTRKVDLKNLTLDLTDNLFEATKAFKAKQKELEKLESEVNFLKSNIRSCLDYGQRHLEYPPAVLYCHDEKDTTVKVEMIANELIVTETNLTLPYSS